jgi:hypothetical protein
VGSHFSGANVDDRSSDLMDIAFAIFLKSSAVIRKAPLRNAKPQLSFPWVNVSSCSSGRTGACTFILWDIDSGCAGGWRTDCDFDRLGDVESVRMAGTETQSVGELLLPLITLNQAFYLLTLPLTVGPGSISVAITLGANETAHNLGANLLALLAAGIGCALVAATVYPC